MEERIYTVEYILENEIDKKAYGFIYVTTNLVNGKKYIGQKKFDNRWKAYLGSGQLFKKALVKYGKENFTKNILAITYDKKSLNTLEISFIKKYNAIKSSNYYNVACGGEGGDTCLGKTKEEMNIISINKSNARKGKKHSEQTIAKIKASNKGKVRSEETRLKISQSIKGKTGENSRSWGRVVKQQTKDKIRKSLNGRIPTHIMRKVICLTTNKIFNSIKEGCEYYYIEGSHISSNCKNIRKSAGKHPINGEKLKWMYYEDYLNLHNKNEIDSLKVAN